MNLFKLLFLVVMPLLMSSCGYIYGDNGLIKSREYDYLNSKVHKDLVIPTSLSLKNKSDYALLPNIGEKARTTGLLGKELDHNAPIQLLAVLENTRVDRKASVPTVFIADRKDFVWQTATSFLAKNNIKAVVDKENGEIVTQWLALEKGGVWLGLDGEEEEGLLRAKFQFKMKPGEIKGEQILVVERIQNQIREDDDLPWQDKAIGWKESANMMNLLLSYYDIRIREQDARLQQQVMAGFKVTLGHDAENNPALLTEAKETLVWEKIPKVMKRLGFKIIDKDVRQKTYFMEYKAPEDGFFASLFDDETLAFPLDEGAFQMTVGDVGELRSLTFKDEQGESVSSALLVKLFPEFNRLFGGRH